MKTLFLSALCLLSLPTLAQEADSRFCQLQPSAAAPLLPADDAHLAALQQQEEALNAKEIRLAGIPKLYCKQDFRLPSSALPAFKDEVAQTLGSGWEMQQLGETLYWESKSRFWPKKYYALLQEAAATPDTLILRSLYAENSNSALHSYVVFGVALSPFLIVLAFIPALRRRIRHKKRAQGQL